MKFNRSLVAAAALAASAFGGSAHASLTAFQTYTGNYAVSTDGWGSAVSSSGIISASVPLGATVVAAYLYTSSNNALAGAGGTFAGSAVNYTALPAPGGAASVLQAGRADVTNLVKPLIDGGAGGLYNFNVTETNTVGQDGEALVVVYQLASLATTTVGILDGFSSPAGDTTTLNFAQPLDPTAAGFNAELRLGIGFSADGNSCATSAQTSSVTVNSTTITRNAGCNDDSVDAMAATGNLITVGGFDDAYSPLLPSTAADHERYNLNAQIAQGSTSIQINTLNPSGDDNIFLAVLQVSGVAGINVPPVGVPEPMTLGLVALALAGLGTQRKFARR